MFVHKNHLEPLLHPWHYTEEGWYRAGLERLFRPSWHLVGTTRDLARPGDFVTLCLLGEPVMVRNAGGRLAAFQNVCPHRRSLVRAQPRGNMPRLRCRYHGWEFDDAGRAAVPVEPGEREDYAYLTPLRVAAVGEMVFVSLVSDGESLREFLGPLYSIWESGFDGTDFRLADHWEHEFDCNWKVIVENSLESYHLPEIHPTTFGPMPAEENCEHVLDDRYTTFTTPTPRDRVNRAQDWMVRRLGLPVTATYTHQNVHPHLTFSCLDVFRMAMVVYPLSVGRSLYRVWVYTARGRRRNPVAWASAAILRGIVRWIGRKVYWEDGRLYPSVQAGLRASPHRGVLGTREERIYYFQQHVVSRCEGYAAVGSHQRTLN